jgi:hypothetical protein
VGDIAVWGIWGLVFIAAGIIMLFVDFIDNMLE